MTFTHIGSLLDDYLDQELPEPVAREVTTHLESCAACRTEHEEALRLRALLSGYQPPAPPEEYWDEVSGLILARTVEGRTEVVDLPTEAARARSERYQLYRSIAAVAASLVVFFSALLTGPESPLAIPGQLADGSQTEAPNTLLASSTPESSNLFSEDEQALIAGGMLLVGGSGLFASPADMTTVLGLE
jgi:anti-sigma factor RsiW